MVRRAATVTAFLIFAACTAEPTSAPSLTPSGAQTSAAGSEAMPILSVTGHFGTAGDRPDPSPFVVQHVSFVAQMSTDGSVSGHAHSLGTFPTSGIHSSWTEDVVCLVVEGNIAWMGTVVVHTTPGSLVPVGRRYVYHMVDNDKEPDLLQRGPNLPDCRLRSLLPLIESMQGEIRIHDRR